MNKTLTIFGAGLLVAGSLALNMIRYPVVWDMVGAPPVQQAAVVAQAAAAAERTALLPTTPPVQQPAPSSPPSDAAPTFAIERLPPTGVGEDSTSSQRVTYSGIERPPSGSLVAPVAPPPPNAVPLGRLEAAQSTPTAEPAAMTPAAMPAGKAWPAEEGQTSFALASPALRPLGETKEPRHLQPVEPVSVPVLTPPQDTSIQRLPPVDFATAPPVFDLNNPLPDGTVQIYPRAEGR